MNLIINHNSTTDTVCYKQTTVGHHINPPLGEKGHDWTSTGMVSISEQEGGHNTFCQINEKDYAKPSK